MFVGHPAAWTYQAGRGRTQGGDENDYESMEDDPQSPATAVTTPAGTLFDVNASSTFHYQHQQPHAVYQLGRTPTTTMTTTAASAIAVEASFKPSTGGYRSAAIPRQQSSASSAPGIVSSGGGVGGYSSPIIPPYSPLSAVHSPSSN